VYFPSSPYILYVFVSVTRFDEEHKLPNSSICNFLHHPVSSSHLDPNIVRYEDTNIKWLQSTVCVFFFGMIRPRLLELADPLASYNAPASLILTKLWRSWTSVRTLWEGSSRTDVELLTSILYLTLSPISITFRKSTSSKSLSGSSVCVDCS
jgi:hypothetical protein